MTVFRRITISRGIRNNIEKLPWNFKALSITNKAVSNKRGYEKKPQFA